MTKVDSRQERTRRTEEILRTQLADHHAPWENQNCQVIPQRGFAHPVLKAPLTQLPNTQHWEFLPTQRIPCLASPTFHSWYILWGFLGLNKSMALIIQ